MSSDDARFEDAGGAAPKPLRLRAEGPDDLEIISSLLQDAVGRAGDVTWMQKKRRLVAQVNRFRWEGHAEAAREQRPFERVRSALTIEGVLKVRSRGLDPARREQVYDLLALTFAPGEDGAGVVTILLAGDGELAVDVECLEVSLGDISAPWPAQATSAPDHQV